MTKGEKEGTSCGYFLAASFVATSIIMSVVMVDGWWLCNIATIKHHQKGKKSVKTDLAHCTCVINKKFNMIESNL